MRRFVGDCLICGAAVYVYGDGYYNSSPPSLCSLHDPTTKAEAERLHKTYINGMEHGMRVGIEFAKWYVSNKCGIGRAEVAYDYWLKNIFKIKATVDGLTGEILSEEIV